MIPLFFGKLPFTLRYIPYKTKSPPLYIYLECVFCCIAIIRRYESLNKKNLFFLPVFLTFESFSLSILSKPQAELSVNFCLWFLIYLLMVPYTHSLKSQVFLFLCRWLWSRWKKFFLFFIFPRSFNFFLPKPPVKSSKAVHHEDRSYIDSFF